MDGPLGPNVLDPVSGDLLRRGANFHELRQPTGRDERYPPELRPFHISKPVDYYPMRSKTCQAFFAPFRGLCLTLWRSVLYADYMEGIRHG